MSSFTLATPVRCLARAAIAAWLLGTAAAAVVEVKAKAIMTSAKAHEAIGVIRIDLKNPGDAALGPLTVQYRFSGYREFDAAGKPLGAVAHQDATVTQELLAPGQQASIDSPGMTLAADKAQRKLFHTMLQSLRVRVWHHGRLVGEFTEPGGAGAGVEWPLNPPPVPAGAEAGSGPWLLLTKNHAEFSGLALGAPAAGVLTMLKTCGPGRVDAKPDPLHGHPFRMSAASMPGCVFGFDAGKLLSAIAITSPSSLKLPANLVLGTSRLVDFDTAFGPGSQPAPLPPGAAAARCFQLNCGRLTLTANSASPDIASAALLERTP